MAFVFDLLLTVQRNTINNILTEVLLVLILLLIFNYGVSLCSCLLMHASADGIQLLQRIETAVLVRSSL